MLGTRNLTLMSYARNCLVCEKSCNTMLCGECLEDVGLSYQIVSGKLAAIENREREVQRACTVCNVGCGNLGALRGRFCSNYDCDVFYEKWLCGKKRGKMVGVYEVCMKSLEEVHKKFEF